MTAPVAHQTEVLIAESAGEGFLQGVGPNMIYHVTQL